MINFDTQKASRSFKILCVAFLFKFLDITINGINLLPDTVGCLLFIAGLGGCFPRVEVLSPLQPEENQLDFPRVPRSTPGLFTAGASRQMSSFIVRA